MSLRSIDSTGRRPGAVVRAARRIGKWFSRAAQVPARFETDPHGDRWDDYPRFPPF